MPGLALLFWLVVAATFCGACVIAAVLWKAGKHRKSAWMIRLGGVSLGVLALILLSFAFVAVRALVRSSVPRYVFEDELEQIPPATVSDIQSEVNDAFGGRSVYLKFKCSPEVFHQLVPANLPKSEVRAFPDFLCLQPNRRRPSWWAPDLKRVREAYGRGHDRELDREEILLLYDPGEGAAYYSFSYID